MTAVTYHAPNSVAQALGLLAAHPGARVLAGGTDLIVQTRSGRIGPPAFTDLKHSTGL